MTKGEIKLRISQEQQKLDDLINELLRQKKSLQCMVVIKQTLKLSQLKELLHNIGGIEDVS